MQSLLLNVLGSLIAAVIVVAASVRLSRTVRRALTAAASELLGIDVKYVHVNEQTAQEAIRQELATSTEVRIFAGRGNQFQATLYKPLLEPAHATRRRVRVLLPNAYSRPSRTDWIGVRENELAPMDRAFGGGQLARQIRTSIEHVEPHLQPDRFELRLFDLPHIGRIILTDRFAFFTPYADGKHGRDCRIFQYGRGDMYDAFARFFEMAWSDSADLKAIDR